MCALNNAAQLFFFSPTQLEETRFAPLGNARRCFRQNSGKSDSQTKGWRLKLNLRAALPAARPVPPSAPTTLKDKTETRSLRGVSPHGLCTSDRGVGWGAFKMESHLSSAAS